MKRNTLRSVALLLASGAIAAALVLLAPSLRTGQAARLPTTTAASNPWAATCPASFRFSVTGDPRDNVKGFTEVLQGIKDQAGGAGAFSVSVGDNTPPGNIRAAVDKVLGRGTVWFAAVGNHEARNRDYVDWLNEEYALGHDGRTPLLVYTRRNGPPGSAHTTYSWDYGPAHFVMINEYWDGGTGKNSDRSAPGIISDALFKWLAADLAGNRKGVTFVIGHEPAYPQSRHEDTSLDADPKRRDAFWKLLEERGVQAYICGHTHYYSRHQNKGGRTWQVDVGNAGKTPEAKEGKTFAIVTVSPSEVRYDVWRDEGGKEFKLADTWTEAIAQPATATKP